MSKKEKREVNYLVCALCKEYWTIDPEGVVTATLYKTSLEPIVWNDFYAHKHCVLKLIHTWKEQALKQNEEISRTNTRALASQSGTEAGTTEQGSVVIQPGRGVSETPTEGQTSETKEGSDDRPTSSSSQEAVAEGASQESDQLI